MKPNNPSRKIKDLRIGDVFIEPRGGRPCELVEHEVGLIVQSLVDGWAGRAVIFADLEVTPLELPKTAAELIRFIRKYQYQGDDDYDD